MDIFQAVYANRAALTFDAADMNNVIRLAEEIVNLIPEEWLLIDSPFKNIEDHRHAYTQFLTDRFIHSQQFVKEAQHARQTLI